jgi:hypothetical protein
VHPPAVPPAARVTGPIIPIKQYNTFFWRFHLPELAGACGILQIETNALTIDLTKTHADIASHILKYFATNSNLPGSRFRE